MRDYAARQRRIPTENRIVSAMAWSNPNRYVLVRGIAPRELEADQAVPRS